MHISVTGIVVNEYNHVLLTQRSDIRSWEPPTGLLRPGELPTDGTARVVQKSTGLLVMPVRLVGLEFVSDFSHSRLNLDFRCIMRGGALEKPAGIKELGFQPSARLPTPMQAQQRQRIKRALTHSGGSPHLEYHTANWREKLGQWLLNNIGRYLALARGRHIPITPTDDSAPIDWQVSAYVVVRDEGGRILWVKRAGRGPWHLPGGQGSETEAPWETAVRQTQLTTGIEIEIQHLAGIYVYPEHQNMTFVFTAEAVGGHIKEDVKVIYLIFGEESVSTFSTHVTHVSDVLEPAEETIFRTLSQP